MPCLVLDPNREAKSVAGFAKDIEHLLESEAKHKTAKFNETLAARSPDEIKAGAAAVTRSAAGVLASARNGVSARLTAGRNKGTHYLGLIAGINHAFDAKGGVATTVILTKCRTHTEGTDIFGEPEDAGRDPGRVQAKHVRKHHAKYTYGTSLPTAGWYVKCRKGSLPQPAPAMSSIVGSAVGDFVTDVVVVGAVGGKMYNYFPMLQQKYLKKTDGTSWTERGRYKVGTSKDKYVAGKDSGALKSFSGAIYVKVSSIKKGTLKSASRTSVDHTTGFTFEQAATPPWFSHIYHPDLIGEKFYAYMAGCLSVLDGPILLSDPDGKGIPQAMKSLHAKSSNDLFTGEDIQQKGLLRSFFGSESYTELFGKEDATKENHFATLGGRYYTIAGSDNNEVKLPSSIASQQTSVFQAAESLAEVYLALTENNINVDRWVDSYTGRRYASMADMFGKPATKKGVALYKDPHLVLRGPMDHETLKDPKDKPYGLDALNVLNEGFHTFAFGAMDEGTCLPGWEPLPTALAKSTRTPPGFVDPRVTRWERVKAYAEEISAVGTETRLK
jgi:hypothetical protein